MWASSVWGLIGVCVTLWLAMISLPPDWSWLQPWLFWGGGACFLGSVVVLIWPLQHARNRIIVRTAIQHPMKSVTELIEPLHIIALGILIVLAGTVWQWKKGSAPENHRTESSATAASLKPAPTSTSFLKDVHIYAGSDSPPTNPRFVAKFARNGKRARVYVEDQYYPGGVMGPAGWT